MQFQEFFYSLHQITTVCSNTPHYANLKHIMVYPVVCEISLENWQYKYVVPLEMQLAGQIFRKKKHSQEILTDNAKDVACDVFIA